MGERKERRLRREAEAAAERDRIEQEKAAQQADAEEAQPEQSDVQENPAEPQGEAEEHRENAPRRTYEAAQPRKRRRAKINLQAAVVLLVFALLMGVVLGYVLGRSAGDRRADEAETQLAKLRASLEAQQQEAEAVQSAEDANEEALAALAGEAALSDGDSDLLMGTEDLAGDAQGAAPADEVVAEFDGGELRSGEVIEEYNARLARYMFEGYSEAEVSDTLLREVMEDMVFERVLESHAKELGVYELSAADEQQIAAEAQQRYEEQLGYCLSLVRTDGMSDAEAEAAAQSYLLESEGVNLESIEAELRAGWWMDKLYGALTADVSVGSGEIMEAYNEALSDQKERFLANAQDYEAAQMSGEVIVYNLPGYRRVRMLGLSFDSFDVMTAVDDLTLQLAALDASADAAQIEELQAQLDAYYAPLEEKAGAVLQPLAAGGDMQSLIR